MFLLHLLLHSFVLAWMLCCGVVLSWYSVGLARVSECEVHLCAVSASFYVAIYNFCACIVFRDTFLSLGVNKKNMSTK